MLVTLSRTERGSALGGSLVYEEGPFAPVDVSWQAIA
jgi:hypothetical protein